MVYVWFVCSWAQGHMCYIFLKKMYIICRNQEIHIDLLDGIFEIDYLTNLKVREVLCSWSAVSSQ